MVPAGHRDGDQYIQTLIALAHHIEHERLHSLLTEKFLASVVYPVSLCHLRSMSIVIHEVFARRWLLHLMPLNLVSEETVRSSWRATALELELPDLAILTEWILGEYDPLS